jgi:hypothetical protein
MSSTILGDPILAYRHLGISLLFLRSGSTALFGPNQLPDYKVPRVADGRVGLLGFWGLHPRHHSPGVPRVVDNMLLFGSCIHNGLLRLLRRTFVIVAGSAQVVEGRCCLP